MKLKGERINHKAVFLDRDGVINRKAPEGDYIKKWDEFKFLSNVKEAIKKLNENGFLVIIITNQQGVAKGIITKRKLNEIHKKMLNELNKTGAKIKAIYYCPHNKNEECECRKPNPGLILMAAKKYKIILNKSWMVGDSESDIEAGMRAGCKTILISSKGNDKCQIKIRPLYFAKSLSEAVNIILKC